MQINKKIIHTQFVTTSSSFIALSVGWLLFLLCIRIVEFIYEGSTHQFPPRPLLLFLFACLSDLIFWLKISIVLIIIYFLITIINKKAAQITYLFITLLITIGHIALIQYFNTTLVPLGKDLYGYSWKDIQQTVGASGGINIWTIALLLLTALALIMWLNWFSKKIHITGKWNYFGLTAAAMGTIVISNQSFTAPVHNEFSKNIILNKTDFFITASRDFFFPKTFETDIYADAYIGYYDDMDSNAIYKKISYVDEKNYPFLHQNDTADVLSPFFDKTSTPPHIVILIIEGLGRAFSNQKAYLRSFTPFLDSLSQQGLYWENCLSNGGRTFAVLPSILGSLPFGKHGFNELNPAPPHLSLISILKKQGYYTSFYYGGDASFDKMKAFLQQQQTDHIFDQYAFPDGYQKLPTSNGFSWGYEDKEVYRYFLDRQNKYELKQPSLQILLTVTTHSPFLLNNQDIYLQYLERYLVQQSFSEEQKNYSRRYKLQFSSILYADESLRYFFTEYKKYPNYSNTIFIITGDHRMPEIPMSTKIDRFHVPLIIYSPLLARKAKFSSISSHFDITPSILAYLNSNFNIKVPSLVSWVGSGLDTIRNKRNTHIIPLMQTKTDLVDFVLGNYHLNGNEVFELSDQLNENPVIQNNIKENIQATFQLFKQKNDRLAQSAKLIPDSIYNIYYPR